MHNAVEYETVWTGATWREDPQPTLGTVPDRDVTADIRAHLMKNADKWYLSKNLAVTIKADSAGVQVRLRQLVQRGEVIRQHVTCPDPTRRTEQRWVYRWAGSGQGTPTRRYRSKDIAVMRARLRGEVS